MRAFIAVRHAYARDVVARAAAAGIRQVVIVGVGLDTTAYRPESARLGIDVFEVDLPATQAWKRTTREIAEMLAGVGFAHVEDLGLDEFGPRYLGVAAPTPRRPVGHVVGAARSAGII